MNEDQVRKIIKEELAGLIGSDRYSFIKHLQLQDGRNIILSAVNGSKIGTTTTQKLGFYGKLPVVQAGAITTPTAPGAGYVQSEAASAKTAIDAIRTALTNLGLTA